MSTLNSLIRRAPKRFSANVAMIAVAVIVPAAVFAWGPSRAIFTIEKPAPYVTFNSITNNPSVGDERNFVGIRETTAANQWSDDMTVQPGKEYYVRMYVHNNAAANLNLVAENVTAKFNLPTTTGKSIQVNGFLNASNVGADNKGNNGAYAEVYDHATFNSASNFNLDYIEGSLKYENNIFGTAGTPLSENIFTNTGTKLGYDKLDGKIPGCFKYDGYVTFKVKPQFAQTTNFSLTKMVSKHGEAKWTETYAAQPGEVVDFILAYKNTGEATHNDVTFRDTLPTGLSYEANSNTWSNGRTQNVPVANNDLTNGTGINVGSYATKANAYTVFSAKVASKEQLKCGLNTFVNKGKVNTGGYAVEDTATVTVNKDCIPPVVKITVCELSTKKIITIEEKNFDASKHSKNLDDCKVVVPEKMTVCELATKKIVTINKTEYNESEHSTDLAKCAEPPVVVTPPELPHTGAGDNIVAVLGLGSIVAGVAYYVASRRALGL